MGCCLVKEEAVNLKFSFGKVFIEENLSEETDEQGSENKDTLSFKKLEIKALEVAGISDIVSAMDNVQTTSNINASDIPCIYPFVPVPSTVRALALAYLCIRCGEQMKSLKGFLRKKCKMLTGLMNEYNEDIRIYILIFMVKCLQTQSRSVKAILLEHSAMKAFITMYKDPQRQVRLLAAEASGLLMRNFENAQKNFIEANGHEEIVQLLKREETDSHALLILFEVIFDLVYDQLGDFIPRHLRALLDKQLFDIIYSLDLFNKSFEVAEAVDEILQLCPWAQYDN